MRPQGTNDFRANWPDEWNEDRTMNFSLRMMIAPVLVAGAAVVALAVPGLASASTSAVNCVPSPDTGTHVHIQLSNCEGGTVADFGRGLSEVSGSPSIVLKTYALVPWHIVPVGGEPTVAHPLATFYIKYGTRYLRADKTHAWLSVRPELFGSYPGAGFNGPRYILEANANGTPVAGDLGLTAAGKVLKLAVTVPADTGHSTQTWAMPFIAA